MSGYRRNILIVLLCVLANTNVLAQYTYKPIVGDKFQYKISNGGGKYYQATFIFDRKQNLNTFYCKYGNENPKWGSWRESKSANSTLVIDLNDSACLSNSNLIYINADLFKQIKAGKNFKLTIQKNEIDFKCAPTADYKLPLEGAGLDFKVLTANSIDNRWIINILDNPTFPLITALLGEVSWQLQIIVPVPMFPITQNLIGTRFDERQASMFRAYINETCAVLDATYTENFRKVEFNEYFCPTVGVRFSLKNDTIVSLQLVSENSTENGFDWQTYRGYIWGVYGLGVKQKTIEKKIGRAISTVNQRNYYPNHRFYLIYNENGILETVEYE